MDHLAKFQAFVPPHLAVFNAFVPPQRKLFIKNAWPAAEVAAAIAYAPAAITTG